MTVKTSDQRSWARTRDDLVRAIEDLVFRTELGNAIAKHFGSPKAMEQAEKAFSGIDLSAYEDVLFIGKSIGTIVAAKIASESPDRDKIRLILYTPLPDTFSFTFGRAIAFTGTDDPWVGGEKSQILALCGERNISCTMIPWANHSLESGNVFSDQAHMQGIMKETEDFIRGET